MMQCNLELKDGIMLAEEAACGHLCAGDWLAGDSSYQTCVEALSGSDPRLRNRDPKAVLQKIPWADTGRVAVLELGDDGTFGPATEFRDVDRLRDHLASTRAKPVDADEPRAHRRVYILESMGPGFVGVFGEHFGMHPSVFVDQERVIVMNTAAQGESDGMLLPSLSCLAGSPVPTDPSHVTLKYYETVQFDRCPDNFRLVCGDTGRHIGVSRTDGRFTDVGVVRRKCTLWTRSTAHGGWDYVILSDPAVRCVRTGFEYRDVFPVQTRPYQRGYVDFVPEWAQLPGSGPPRTSLLDDLVYYLQTHVSLVGPGALDSPDLAVGTFVRKIVASHYLKLAGNVRAILSSAQRALSRKHDLASLSMEKVEELWSDIQASERRVGEYGEDLEAIMLKLGLPLEKPDPGRRASTSAAPLLTYSPSALSLRGRTDTGSTLGGMRGEDVVFSLSPASPVSEDGTDFHPAERRQWLDVAVDYQFLLLRFRELRHRTECLNAAVTGLASITGNRQAYHEQQLALETARRSIREAKSSKAVTLLGLIFIPLAYTSSLFSMTEPFNPGGAQFWLYFVASAPLIVVVMAAYTVLDAGYTDDGTSWSLAVFRKTARSWFGR